MRAVGQRAAPCPAETTAALLRPGRCGLQNLMALKPHSWTQPWCLPASVGPPVLSSGCGGPELMKAALRSPAKRKASRGMQGPLAASAQFPGALSKTVPQGKRKWSFLIMTWRVWQGE